MSFKVKDKILKIEINSKVYIRKQCVNFPFYRLADDRLHQRVISHLLYAIYAVYAKW